MLPTLLQECYILRGRSARRRPAPRWREGAVFFLDIPDRPRSMNLSRRHCLGDWATPGPCGGTPGLFSVPAPPCDPRDVGGVFSLASGREAAGALEPQCPSSRVSAFFLDSVRPPATIDLSRPAGSGRGTLDR